MSATVYISAAGSARNMAARRLRIGDGVALPAPDGAGVNFRRVDAAFVLSPPATEVSGIIEQLWNSGQIVRVKNTSGSSMPAGTLLARTVSTLTNQTSVTATNSPSAGASVAITMSSSTGFEVGNLVSITDSASPYPVDYALVSAVTTGQITVDFLPYSTTTPTVTALPCYTATLATNASGGYADWVLAAALANGAYGWAFAAADVSGLATNAFSVGAFVYLGTAGAFTTAPTSITTTAQIVGEVEVSDASVGRIKFFPGQRRVTKFSQSALQPGVGVPAGVTAGDILIDQGSGTVATWNAMSGDATINSSGALTIGSAKVTVPKGGTGLATLTAHALQVGNGTGTVTQVGPSSSTAFPLVSGGASADPAFALLGVAGGGTGVATLAAHGVLIGNTASAVNVTGAGTSGQVLTSNGASADPTFQAAANGYLYGRCTSQLNKTSDTSLVNITGMSVAITSGRTYKIKATFFITAGTGGGYALSFATTGSISSTLGEESEYNFSTGALTFAKVPTYSFSFSNSGSTSYCVKYDMVIVCSGTGNLNAQFAQATSNGTASSLLANSDMLVWDIT